MSINTFTRPVATAGNLFAYDLDAFRGIFRRPFRLREFLQQAWFVASVTIVPTALVAIPFGVAIALQVGASRAQLGAQSFTGSAAVLAVIREAGPNCHRTADRRRRRLRDRSRPRCPQDPRGGPQPCRALRAARRRHLAGGRHRVVLTLGRATGGGP
jgi:hypothetical protein